uniref:Uncharacterized protein n=1 Tax=Anguilla anguilla TaxID=7936 RepID=A0A0E9UA08_ANGAN
MNLDLEVLLMELQ